MDKTSGMSKPAESAAEYIEQLRFFDKCVKEKDNVDECFARVQRMISMVVSQKWELPTT